MAALSLATFVSALDNTIVNVALPQIQRDLGVATASLEWVVAAYVLTFASLMFLGGRLADQYGRRATFSTGLVIFAIASGGAALADSSALLIAARALQGVGSALILPASLSILGADVSARARAYGAGIATAAAAVALALGPVLGGLISDYWHWSGIFVVNLPVVAICLVLAWWGVPSVPGSRRLAAPGTASPLGLAGIVSAGLMVSSAVWLLIEAGRTGWGSPITLMVLGTGVAATSTFVALARAGRATIVDGPLLRNKVFGGAVVASSLWGLGINGVFFFTSLYLQLVLELSPATSGVVFVPVALGLVAVVAAIGPVISWIGARVAITVGLILVGLGMVWISLLGPAAGVADLIGPMLVLGVGSGMTVPLTPVALAAVDTVRMGMASSLVTASREVSGAFGVAAIGAVVASRSAGLSANGVGEQLALLGGFQWGLRIAAVLMVVAAVVTVRTLGTLGDEPLGPSGHR